jgi:hypothetical protein
LLIQSFEDGTINNGSIGELPLLHKDGNEVWFEWRLSLDEDNRTRFLLVWRDITDRRERHRLELENARLAVTRAKDEEAMAFFSHELKTRFSTCLGLLTSVRQTVHDLEPRALRAPYNAAECFDDLTGQLQRGLCICMDAAVAKQLMHDTYEVRARSVDLRDELRKFCGRRLALHVEESLPTLLQLDGNLLLHVLENFASNAGKYGGGDVHVRVGRVGASLTFAVINTPGKHHAAMCELYGEDASALFDLGTQGPQADAMSNCSGLYLVAKCAAVLGGTPTLRFLDDEVHAELSLPLTEAAAMELPAGTRIASLDDDELTREMDTAAFVQLGVEAYVRGKSPEEIEV